MRDAKAKKKERKAEIGQLKKEVSDLRGICDSKAKELVDNKDFYEELQSFRDQATSLQKSLCAEKLAKEEVDKVTEERNLQLKEHD